VNGLRGTVVKVDEYIKYNCYTFKNSLFFATGPISRWRCPTYHPERNLMVPASSFEILKNPSSNSAVPHDRDIFMYFRATCLQRPMNEDFNLTDVLSMKVSRL
jgi:hypothetical protein